MQINVPKNPAQRLDTASCKPELNLTILLTKINSTLNILILTTTLILNLTLTGKGFKLWAGPSLGQAI